MLPSSSAVRQVTRRTALVLRLLLLVWSVRTRVEDLSRGMQRVRVALQTSCESCRDLQLFRSASYESFPSAKVWRSERVNEKVSVIASLAQAIRSAAHTNTVTKSILG